MPNQPDNSIATYRDNVLVGVHTNVRMRRSVLLLAELLVNPTADRITHLALGNGIGNGTLALPQEPNTIRETMRQEFNRVPISGIVFDDLENTEGDTFTDGERSNRVRISTTVQDIECANLITEIALFGGDGADQVNGGTIFAWSTFPVIDNRLGGDNPEAPQDLFFDWVLKFPLIVLEEA